MQEWKVFRLLDTSTVTALKKKGGVLDLSDALALEVPHNDTRDGSGLLPQLIKGCRIPN